jgi:hypothetical protein
MEASLGVRTQVSRDGVVSASATVAGDGGDFLAGSTRVGYSQRY